MAKLYVALGYDYEGNYSGALSFSKKAAINLALDIEIAQVEKILVLEVPDPKKQVNILKIKLQKVKVA